MEDEEVYEEPMESFSFEDQTGASFDRFFVEDIKETLSADDMVLDSSEGTCRCDP